MSTRNAKKPRFLRANHADLESVVPLIEAYYTLDEIPYDERSVRRGLQQLLGDSSLGAVWLIELEQSIAGYFVLTFGFDLEFGGRVGTITELYLTPSARRRGLGTAALAFVEATLCDGGVHALELQVEHDNIEALACYEKFGMTKHARVPMSKRLLK